MWSFPDILTAGALPCITAVFSPKPRAAGTRSPESDGACTCAWSEEVVAPRRWLEQGTSSTDTVFWYSQDTEEDDPGVLIIMEVNQTVRIARGAERLKLEGLGPTGRSSNHVVSSLNRSHDIVC